jgi:hypothetical protein
VAYIVNSETSLSGEALNSFDVPIPSGYEADDLLVAIITQDGGGTVIAASGWTQISTQAAVQGQRTTAFYKFATGSSEADLSLTGSNDEWIVNISVIRGADLSTPINVSVRTNSANSTTAHLDSGTVTTTEDNCLVLYACGRDGVFKIKPENPSTLMMLSRETDFVGCTQVVGYMNQITAGVTPNVRFLFESASEGGNALVIAIQDADPATALLSPTITQNYNVLKNYGGVTTATNSQAAFIRHDGITWDVATTLTPAAIDGLTIYDGTFTQVTFQDVNRPWGSMTGLSIGGSALDDTGRWVGATHAVASTDFTNKIFSVEFMQNSVAASRFGAKGCIVVFEDSLGEWAAFTLSLRAGLIAAVSNTCYIDVENTPQLDASGSLDWSDITRVGYLYHKTTIAIATFILRIKNALLHDKTVFVDGNVNDPCSPAKLQQALEGWGGAGLASVQGGGQGLSRAGVQYGNGSRKTYASSTATSYEMPLRENASLARRFWRIPDNVVGAEFRLLASANDVVDMTTGVMAVDVEQDWTIDASSSSSASYSFSGLSVIGWNVTHNVTGITINGATFKNCHITLNGGLLSSCGISSLKSPLSTNNPENITSCAFTSTGTGHAIEITATGTFDMTGNTFTGYGADTTTDAAIYNNSGGAVTISIPLGGQVPTVRDGAGASTSIVLPDTTFTFQLPNIIDDSRFQVYNITQDVELTNTAVSGGLGVDVVYTKGIDYDAGDVGRYRVTYQSGVDAKGEIEGTFTFPTDTAVGSIPIAQTDQTNYNLYGVDGFSISEFIWDSGNIEVDVNDTDNTTVIQRLAAWYYYFITTAEGIDEAFGALTWENINSIKINTTVVDMKLDNTKAASPLTLKGGRIYRDDGTTIIASASNSLQIDYEPVYVVETSSGGGGDDAATIYTYFTDGTRSDAFKADVSGLSTFDPATDTVANVTLVDTVTTNTDMRGTDDALLAASYTAPDNASIAANGTAIGNLNNLSSADVNAACDTALADYDAPTKAELDAGFAALNDISVSDILSAVIESGYTLQEAMRLYNAVLLSKVSGAGTGTEIFRDINDTKNRVTATIDSSGNRTTITLDGA